jgi:hypothetical protein
MFTPNIWAHFFVSCNRITNGYESFYSYLNSSFYSNHPNIYNCIDVSVEIQSEMYIKWIKKENRNRNKK